MGRVAARVDIKEVVKLDDNVMKAGEFAAMEDKFDSESNELLNKICDTFHDELNAFARKYGKIYLSIEVVD